MKKIVVFGVNFNDEQKSRLEKLGEVSYLSSPNSSSELVQQSTGFDVICSDGAFLLESLPRLSNVFVTYPFIELGAFNSEVLKKTGFLWQIPKAVAAEQLLNGHCLWF